MPQRELDSGDYAALLCHWYGIKPWELNKLEREQRNLLIDKIPMLRFYHDLPAIKAGFAKLGDEGVSNLLKEDSEPSPKLLAAWDVYALQPYGMSATPKDGPAAVTPLTTLSPEAAEGLVRWWENGDLYRLPDGADIWRVHLADIYRRLIKRAEELPKQPG